MYLIKKEVTQAKGDTETHSTAVTVAGEVTDTRAAEALMANMAKFGKAKANAKGKAKLKAADANLPGLPVPGSVDGKPYTPLAKKINLSSELNGLSNRLVKLIRNTGDLRSRNNLNKRDAATITDLDALIQKATRPNERFHGIYESVVPASAEIIEAALQDKALLAVELMGR